MASHRLIIDLQYRVQSLRTEGSDLIKGARRGVMSGPARDILIEAYVLVIRSIGWRRLVPLSGAAWDNREMTSTPAHLTGLCNLVNYFVFSRGVFEDNRHPYQKGPAYSF